MLLIPFEDYHFHSENHELGFCTGKEHSKSSMSNLKPILLGGLDEPMNSDTKYKKHWLPKDSWGDLGQWRNYDEELAYVRLMNQVYAGGVSDWRLPTRDEAENFYDKKSGSCIMNLWSICT